jgi:hypothetical protein
MSGTAEVSTKRVTSMPAHVSAPMCGSSRASTNAGDDLEIVAVNERKAD